MGNERPSVSAVIDRIDTAGTGTALNELHEFLLQQAPSIAAGQSVGAAIAVPIPDSAPRWAHERPTFSGEAACEPGGGAGASGGPKASAKRFPRGHRRLYAALFIGAMLAILALGVLGGATITRLLTPTPPASALKQPLDPPVRATTSPDTAARSNGAQGIGRPCYNAALSAPGRPAKRGQEPAPPVAGAGDQTDDYPRLESARGLGGLCVLSGTVRHLAGRAR